MKFKDIKLTREEQIDAMVETALEILKEKKEYNLGLQLLEWACEKTELVLIGEIISIINNYEHISSISKTELKKKINKLAIRSKR
jgi:hypothetical protein